MRSKTFCSGIIKASEQGEKAWKVVNRELDAGIRDFRGGRSGKSWGTATWLSSWGLIHWPESQNHSPHFTRNTLIPILQALGLVTFRYMTGISLSCLIFPLQALQILGSRQTELWTFPPSCLCAQFPTPETLTPTCDITHFTCPLGPGLKGSTSVKTPQNSLWNHSTSCTLLLAYLFPIFCLCTCLSQPYLWLLSWLRLDHT